MEGFLERAGDVAAWGGALLWIAAVIASGLVILISLPGGWVALGLCVLWDALHGFSSIGWTRLVIFAALLGVGEVVEALLGSVYVARKGATRHGVIGTFVGGIAGGALGSAVMPVIGTLIGVFAGGFAGAVAGELLGEKRLEPSLRVGLHATVGRMLAVGVKGALAAVGIGISFAAAFRSLPGVAG